MPPPLPASQMNMRQRFSAMRNIAPFMREIWATSKPMTLASIGIRLVRAFLPIATLYIGKLIIDGCSGLGLRMS
jgi:ATP-binding cassette subfamily B protein